MPVYYGSLVNERNLTGNLEALLHWDTNLFANFFLPEGLDKMVAVHTIRRLHGLAPLYHPDPRWMRSEIYFWSKEQQEIWRKLYATTVLEYNPIWNTDVTERTEEAAHRDAQHTGDTAGWSREHEHTGKQSDLYNHAEDTRAAQHQTDTESAEHAGSIEHATGEVAQKTTGTMDSTGTSTEDTTNEQHTTVDNDTTSLSTTDTTEHTTTHQTVVQNLSPENAADYQPDTQTITDGTEDKTGKETTVASGTNDTQTDTHGSTHANGKTTGHEDTTGTLHGDSDDWRTAQNKRHANGAEYGTRGEQAQHQHHDAYQDQTDAKHHAEDGRTDLDRDHEDTAQESLHTRQGNIGVTSTQQLIEAEREVAMYNIYLAIADSFHRTFCLDIYPI